jgi:hypothetical protein
MDLKEAIKKYIKLQRKIKEIIEDSQPQGFFVYPHFLEDDIVSVSIYCRAFTEPVKLEHGELVLEIDTELGRRKFKEVVKYVKEVFSIDIEKDLKTLLKK